jgi:hypothetical protein
MKNYLLSFILISISAISQETKIIGSKDNVEISYQLTELSKGAKKDKYLISISFENKNSYDLFYVLPLIKNNDGTESVGILTNRGFSEITIRNATGLFGSGKQLIGQETVLRTEDNGILLMLEQNRIYNVEAEFNVKTGEKPIITNSYKNTLRKIDEFNLKISEAFVNGIWKSSCGNNQMSLSIIEENGEQKILQNVNGNQIKWIKQSSTSYKKEGDAGSTLTYQKSENKFFYSSSDGNNCTWAKQ